VHVCRFLHLTLRDDFLFVARPFEDAVGTLPSEPGDVVDVHTRLGVCVRMRRRDVTEFVESVLLGLSEGLQGVCVELNRHRCLGECEVRGVVLVGAHDVDVRVVGRVRCGEVREETPEQPFARVGGELA